MDNLACGSLLDCEASTCVKLPMETPNYLTDETRRKPRHF